MKIKQAIISDAGVSSRFLPIVKTIPKSFLPLGPKPIIQLLVEECAQAGVEHVIIVAREETKAVFEDYFFNKREDLEKFLIEMGKPERYDSVREIFKLPKITVINQDTSLPYGTASPIISAKPYMSAGEPFLFLQGDDVVFGTKGDCQILVDMYEQNPEVRAIMTAQEVSRERISKLGAVKFKDGTTDELDFIVEKPNPDETPSFLASYGRFLYTWEFFDYIDITKTGKDGELWNVDILTRIAREHKVLVVKNVGKWFTTGDPVSYLEAMNNMGKL